MADKPHISGEISLGHILTALTMVFTFGGFYFLTDWRLQALERVVAEQSKNVDNLRIDNVKTQVLLQNDRKQTKPD